MDRLGSSVLFQRFACVREGQVIPSIVRGAVPGIPARGKSHAASAKCDSEYQTGLSRPARGEPGADDFLYDDVDALSRHMGPMARRTGDAARIHNGSRTGLARGNPNLVRKYVASKGYPNVDIIPHENSFGHLPDGALSPADWQKGLMASQYLMEAIIAGYGYTFGYPGFGGNYENIGADPHASITATIDGRYQRLPMFYALKLIGDPLRGANASLIDVEETDPATISMGLEWRDPHRHVSLYLINKHGTAQKETAVFDVDVSDKPVQVRRYSAAEMTGPMIRPESVVKRDSQKNRLEISLSPYSMTVIDVTLD
jgi:hypothetical protein